MITSPVLARDSIASFSFRTTRLRGVNLGGWFSQVDDLYSKDPARNPGLHAHLRTFLGSADFSQVKTWGFNHVRIPVDYYNVFDRHTLAPDEVALGLLDNALRDAAAIGLGVIFDLHRCPGHDFHSGTLREQAFFHDPACRENARRVWSMLGERFGNRPLVALEILNEPVAPSARVWNEVKDEFCALIRFAAPRSTIVVGSNRWNSATEFSGLTPVDDDNILYSFHCYTPVLFTHQRAPWIDHPSIRIERTWPGDYGVDPGIASRLTMEYGEWSAPRLRASLNAPLQFRAKYNVPVACNEFGAYAPVPPADRLRYLADLIGIFRDANVGWSYWNYKNLDFGIISQGEKLHESLPQYANAQRIDHATLRVLQEAAT